MIKNFQKWLNGLHIILDILVTIFSYCAAYYFQFHILRRPLAPMTLAAYMKAFIAILPMYLLLYVVCRFYQPKRIQGRRREAGNVLTANVVGILLIILILYLVKEQHYSRLLLFFFMIINTFSLVIERNLVRLLLRRVRREGFNQRHVLLVGYSKAAEGFIDRVRRNPQWGYRIYGILDDHMDKGENYKGYEILGSVEDLTEILAENKLDEIVISLSLAEYTKLADVVKCCEKSGVHTVFVPDYDNVIPTQPYTEDLLGLPLVHIRHVPLNGLLNAFIKRTMDIFGALVAIVIFSPVMLLTAILVKTTSKGPVLYKQERIGLHNKPFYMYKFRSMVQQTEEEEKTHWTVKGDSRVTAIGKLIRKTSIDEMPQFFNVLKGDMSLIGPRPERPQFVEKFKEEIPRYMIKHQVRPGITGWAQVNGWRGDTDIRERIDCDLYYIENWSLSFDIKILFLTFFKGFINKNAY